MNKSFYRIGGATVDYEYCKCNGSYGIYIDHKDFGYWDCCVNCERKIEDGYHYYDEPELY